MADDRRPSDGDRPDDGDEPATPSVTGVDDVIGPEEPDDPGDRGGDDGPAGDDGAVDGEAGVGRRGADGSAPEPGNDPDGPSGEELKGASDDDGAADAVGDDPDAVGDDPDAGISAGAGDRPGVDDPSPADGGPAAAGGDDPSGTEVTVQVESTPERSTDGERTSGSDRSGRGTVTARREGSDAERGQVRPGDAGVDPEGSTTAGESGSRSPRSEDELEREILDPEERIGPEEEYCRHCGAVFRVGADRCPDCGDPHPRTRDPPASTKKRPNLAAALSLLLPGAGHLYNEQFGRGAVAFFGTVLLVAGIAFFGLLVNVLVTVLSFGTLSAVGTLILVLAILFGWFLPVSVAAWDAYGQARDLNAG